MWGKDVMTDVVNCFGIYDITCMERIEGGHINDTFLISSASGKYILQTVNENVYKDPEAVMDNTVRISELINGKKDSGIKVPSYLSFAGKNHIKTDDGVFRMYEYMEETYGDSDESIYKAACSFGKYIRVINESKIKLHVAIEDYHNYGRYLKKLTESVSKVGKADVYGEMLDILSSLKVKLDSVFSKNMPVRIIHGDAKIDNIIKSDPPAVIDLDTTLESFLALDYGDIVRSTVRSEDDLYKIEIINKGFFDALDGFITEKEKKSLYYGVLWSVGELAARYLFDSFADVKYFADKTDPQRLERVDELMRQLRFFLSVNF